MGKTMNKTFKITLISIGIIAIAFVGYFFLFGQKTNDATTLVVYSTYGGDERGAYIKERAKNELNINIEFLSAGGGTLADRIIAERDNPQADVVLGLNSLFMHQLRDNQTLAPFAPNWAIALSKRYSNEYFTGLLKTPVVIAYNPNFIDAKDAPTSWLDLVNEKFTGKYIISALTNQTTRMYISGILWRYYDAETDTVSNEGWNVIKSLYQNRGVTNTGFSYADVISGKIPIDLGPYGSIVMDAHDNDVTMAFVNPIDGTPVAIESVAIINGTKKMDDAKRFVEWIGSEDFLIGYANEFINFGIIPTSQEVAAKCNNEVKENFDRFKEQEIDFEIVARHLRTWIEKIELDILGN